ncbi:TetR family transcriptional regulator [Parafrankia colletiae]|uniref:TetR family transcriptional regulator n=1 Tax=Parafrankia colletiae TaxID=573497 RepID=A0A1S1QI34_9ACTN|nr:TetR family transcriptional regulator [Parafrankia colletiae]MCK9901627.1 TetR/AcrR family transcriptional regulator [Frankia sp. Cpl3]OHV32732.1 TetR family transcriptional regulator [Parafrankia colletiae]
MTREPVGLRERKKQRTHDALSAAAIALFLERGFDNVSVAEVAAAAEVSKPTLFAYFPTKEDLVLHRIADHDGEAARVVRTRPPGTAPLPALEEHLLAGLARHDPVTGLNDHPEVLAFHGMVFATPSLAGRVAQYASRDEEALAAALGEAVPTAGDLAAALAASQILAVRRVLARENWRRLSEPRAVAADVLPDAVAEARLAFGALRKGLSEFA